VIGGLRLALRVGRDLLKTPCAQRDGYHKGIGIIDSDNQSSIKFEVVVPDSRVRRIIRVIVGKARTGRINDGKVFVVSIQEAIRIRTGERGEEAV
jgi:nitrogen regulatory protein PII